MWRVLASTCIAVAAVFLACQTANARSMESGEAAAAQKAMVAVVNISTWKIRLAANPMETPRRVKTNASGFIVDPSGIIVTNKHVIDGAFDIKAVLSDGTRLPAKLLAVAAMVDLAVVKVDANRPLPALKWGDSDALQVGDPVLTIGNPLGIGLSVSAGIVSALNRDIGDTPFDNYIQTDAAINHGNSGGPLINDHGDVIGVDTALFNPEESGGFIGIGFAIPADTARFVIDRLLDPSHPKPGWLGFTLQDLTPELSEALGLRDVNGAIVAALDSSGPASTAGLRLGDVVSGVDGAWPGDSRAVMRALVQITVGQPARLSVWRDGKALTIDVPVAEWPNHMPGGGMMNARTAEAMIQRMPDPGLRLAPLTEQTRKQYGIDPKLSGAVIASVEADCEARDLGVVEGDVVTAVQGAPVASPDDIRQAVRAAHDLRRPYLAVLVQGKRGTRWISLSMGSAGS
jgi:serine protease Do